MERSGILVCFVNARGSSVLGETTSRHRRIMEQTLSGRSWRHLFWRLGWIDSISRAVPGVIVNVEKDIVNASYRISIKVELMKSSR
jgi:hypothetical protein